MSCRLPSADTTKPGFIFNISQVAQDTHPNLLANAEKQLAGLFGDNLADPAAVGVASGPAQAPNPSTAPIRFEIPTVINMNKNGGEARGDFHPNQQMPGLPGTTGSTTTSPGKSSPISISQPETSSWASSSPPTFGCKLAE